MQELSRVASVLDKLQSVKSRDFSAVNDDELITDNANLFNRLSGEIMSALVRFDTRLSMVFRVL